MSRPSMSPFYSLYTLFPSLFISNFMSVFSLFSRVCAPFWFVFVSGKPELPFPFSTIGISVMGLAGDFHPLWAVNWIIVFYVLFG